MDFKMITKAGLTQAQFASLVEVSRVTVNTWVKGHFRPGPPLRARVAQALELLKDAVNDGRLPISASVHEELLRRQLDRIANKLARGG